MKKIASAVFLILSLSSPLRAADFGLITSQYATAANEETEDAGHEYRADIMPRFSFLFGDTGKFVVSAGVTLGVGAKNEFYYVPELLLTELFFQSGSWGMVAGRMRHEDPLGFIATGLFDGAKVFHTSSAGIFSAGAWYTGFLYKKNAIITMTPEDQSSYDAPVVYGHFSKTYFASRRLLASLDWEHPSVANFFSLKSAITGQVDLSDSSQKYHSQYVTLKASVPLSRLRLELGGSLEMAQSEDFSIAFAGDFGIFWALPAPFASRLSLTGLFSSGNTGGIIGAFVPVTNKFYGSIIKAKMSGISILNLDYAAMLGDFLGVGLTASHFVRNDLGTYTAWPVNDSGDSGYFMGTEFFARLAWSPLSDVHLILGGGAFLPSLGNVNPGGKPQWRIEMNFIFAIF